jgi:hypothetical protein
MLTDSTGSGYERMGLTFSEEYSLTQNTSERSSNLVRLGVVVRPCEEDVVERNRIRHEQPGATEHAPVSEGSSVLRRPFLVLDSWLCCKHLAQVAEDVVLTARSRELGEGRGVEEGEREGSVGEEELAEEGVGVEEESGSNAVQYRPSAVRSRRWESSSERTNAMRMVPELLEMAAMSWLESGTAVMVRV